MSRYIASRLSLASLGDSVTFDSPVKETSDQLPPGWVLPKDESLVKPFRDHATMRLRRVFLPAAMLWLRRQRRKRASAGLDTDVGACRLSILDALRCTRALSAWPDSALHQLAELSQGRVLLDGEWLVCPGEDGSSGLAILVTGHADQYFAPLREPTRSKGLFAHFPEGVATTLKVAAPASVGSSGVFGEPTMEAARAVGPCVVRLITLADVRAVAATLTPQQRDAADQVHANGLRSDHADRRPSAKELVLVPGLARVPPEILATLAGMLRPILAVPRQTLQQEGVRVQTIGVIMAGRVKVSVSEIAGFRSPSQPELVLGHCTAPMSVSLPDAAGGQPHGHTLKTVTYCELWTAPWADASVLLRSSTAAIGASSRGVLASMFQAVAREPIGSGDPDDALMSCFGSVPLLDHLDRPASWVRELLRRATFHGFLRGETIVRGGDPCDRLWLALRGGMLAGDRRAGEKQALKPGEWHGMTCLFSHRWNRTVIASELTVIAAVSRAAFVAWLQLLPSALDAAVRSAHALLHPQHGQPIPPSIENRSSPPLWPTTNDEDAPSSFGLHTSVPYQKAVALRRAGAQRWKTGPIAVVGRLGKQVGAPAAAAGLPSNPSKVGLKSTVSAVALLRKAGSNAPKRVSVKISTGSESSEEEEASMSGSRPLPQPSSFRKAESRSPTSKLQSASRTLEVLGRMKARAGSPSSGDSPKAAASPPSPHASPSKMKAAAARVTAASPPPTNAAFPKREGTTASAFPKREGTTAFGMTIACPGMAMSMRKQDTVAARVAGGRDLFGRVSLYAVSESALSASVDVADLAGLGLSQFEDEAEHLLSGEDTTAFRPSDQLNELRQSLKHAVARHLKRLSRRDRDMVAVMKHFSHPTPQVATNLPCGIRQNIGGVAMYETVQPPGRENVGDDVVRKHSRLPQKKAAQKHRSASDGYVSPPPPAQGPRSPNHGRWVWEWADEQPIAGGRPASAAGSPILSPARAATQSSPPRSSRTCWERIAPPTRSLLRRLPRQPARSLRRALTPTLQRPRSVPARLFSGSAQTQSISTPCTVPSQQPSVALSTPPVTVKMPHAPPRGDKRGSRPRRASKNGRKNNHLQAAQDAASDTSLSSCSPVVSPKPHGKRKKVSKHRSEKLMKAASFRRMETEQQALKQSIDERCPEQKIGPLSPRKKRPTVPAVGPTRAALVQAREKQQWSLLARCHDAVLRNRGAAGMVPSGYGGCRRRAELVE